MNETHTIVLTLNFSTDIQRMEVFDVGKNKKRIDVEKLHSFIKRNIPNRIKQLSKFLKTLESKTNNSKEVKINIAIPTYILEFIVENDKESYEELKTITKKYCVEFLITTYYSNDLRILPKEELEIQVFASKKFLKKYFDVESNIFYSEQHNLKKETYKTLKELGVKGIVFETSGSSTIIHYHGIPLPVLDQIKINKNAELKKINHVIVHKHKLVDLSKEQTLKDIELIYDQEKTNKIKTFKELFSEGKGLLTPTTKKTLSEKNSLLETKLVEEMKNIYPHIINTKDNYLIEDWRFLANEELIKKANPDVASQEENPYEHFSHFMNILNDVAHTIITVDAVEKNKELPDVQITNNPSELINNNKNNLVR